VSSVEYKGLCLLHPLLALVVSALLYSQYTEFHLEYAYYDLCTYNTLATHQRTSDPVQERVFIISDFF
jgi:hypothetical protein